MRKALEGLEGVKRAEVSFSEKTAVVYFEKGKTTLEKMIDAVSQVGFRATKE